MNEKRFRFLRGQGTHSNVWDSEKRHRDGVGGELWVGEVVGLLNAFVEDINHLKEYCGDLESDLKRFTEENEQLKQRIDFFEQQEMRMEYSQNVINLLNCLYEENEQLRREKDYWKAKFQEGTETFEVPKSRTVSLKEADKHIGWKTL